MPHLISSRNCRKHSNNGNAFNESLSGVAVSMNLVANMMRLVAEVE